MAATKYYYTHSMLYIDPKTTSYKNDLMLAKLTTKVTAILMEDYSFLQVIIIPCLEYFRQQPLQLVRLSKLVLQTTLVESRA